MVRLLQRFLHWCDFADHPDPWGGPEGSFFAADVDATLTYLKTRPEFATDGLDAYLGRLGSSLIASFGDRRFSIIELEPGTIYVEEIKDGRYVRRGKNYLIYEAYSALTAHRYRSLLMKDERADAFWNEPMDCVLVRGYRERFGGITRDEFERRTTGLAFDPDGVLIATEPKPEWVEAFSAMYGK